MLPERGTGQWRIAVYKGLVRTVACTCSSYSYGSLAQFVHQSVLALLEEVCIAQIRESALWEEDMARIPRKLHRHGANVWLLFLKPLSTTIMRLRASSYEQDYNMRPDAIRRYGCSFRQMSLPHARLFNHTAGGLWAEPEEEYYVLCIFFPTIYRETEYPHLTWQLNDEPAKYTVNIPLRR